jgi:hypothetical protein
MTDREKWVEALARLTWKTIEGEIKWQITSSRDFIAEGVDKAFETTFRGQRIRASHMRPFSIRPPGGVIIEFLDANGAPAYQPPFLDGARDLFFAIEHQAKPAGEFIDALLRD